MAEETKKVWKVLLGVEAEKLEDVLNAHVDEGMQAYRIDQFKRKYDEPAGPRVAVFYDVVLFNPMLLGERASKAFTDAVMAQMTATQAPAPGPVPGA